MPAFSASNGNNIFPYNFILLGVRVYYFLFDTTKLVKFQPGVQNFHRFHNDFKFGNSTSGCPINDRERQRFEILFIPYRLILG